MPRSIPYQIKFVAQLFVRIKNADLVSNRACIILHMLLFFVMNEHINSINNPVNYTYRMNNQNNSNKGRNQSNNGVDSRHLYTLSLIHI